MKVGIISDIHSNLSALKAVLSALSEADIILCAGDLTGYYNDPNSVVSEIIKGDIIFIKGNHDHYLDNQPHNGNELLKYSIAYTKEKILPEYKKILGNTPSHRSLTIDGLRFCIYHGSPWDSLEEYIYPDFADFYKFQTIEADIIVLGHTHYSFIKKNGRKIIINPGSCGQPRDGDVRASFAVFDTKKITVELKRIEYDAIELIRSLDNSPFKSNLIKYLPQN